MFLTTQLIFLEPKFLENGSEPRYLKKLPSEVGISKFGKLCQLVSFFKKKPVELFRLFSLTLSVRYGRNWKFTIAKLQIDSSQPVSNVK